MINLENVTLLTIDGIGTDINAIKALKYSTSHIKFNKIKYLTAGTETPSFCETIKINKLSWNDYNKFCLTDLVEYVDTDFVLLIQSDGFIINPNKWCDTFLNYDYLGAPWPMDNLRYNIPRFPLILQECRRTNKVHQVGNGGFTLRSKRLLKMTKELYKDECYGLPEDAVVCNLFRDTLEQKGLNFTENKDYAASFSCEAKNVDGKIYSSDNSFGFHCKDTHADKIKLLLEVKYEINNSN